MRESIGDEGIEDRKALWPRRRIAHLCHQAASGGTGQIFELDGAVREVIHCDAEQSMRADRREASDEEAALADCLADLVALVQTDHPGGALQADARVVV